MLLSDMIAEQLEEPDEGPPRYSAPPNVDAELFCKVEFEMISTPGLVDDWAMASPPPEQGPDGHSTILLEMLVLVMLIRREGDHSRYRKVEVAGQTMLFRGVSRAKPETAIPPPSPAIT